MELIEGSSIEPDVVKQVRSHAEGAGQILVSLDLNHTHQHALAPGFRKDVTPLIRKPGGLRT
jgi:cephalosporin hydroxylase